MLAVAFSSVAAGCGGPELPPLPSGAKVVAFGDSITHGYGAKAGESYPEVLARRTGLDVVNAGVSGEISEQGLARLPGVLERERPRLVILCHGGNDIRRKIERAVTERNLRRMVELARASGASVVMLGVPEPSIMLSTAEVYERIAEEMAVPLEADVVPDVLGDNRLKSDIIHPNAAGYARMAEAVEALLRDTGAL